MTSQPACFSNRLSLTFARMRYTGHKSVHLASIYLLLLVFLMQPLLTYLATPLFISQDNHLAAVSCTLKGQQTEFISADSELGKLLGLQDEYCPALELVDMLASGMTSGAPLITGLLWYQASQLNHFVSISYLHPLTEHYQTRAPPAFS
mgnify:CR=1 FL=1